MILVGVNHEDFFAGSQKLLYLLNRFQPRSVTLELPPNLTPCEVLENLQDAICDIREAIDAVSLPYNFRRFFHARARLLGFDLRTTMQYLDRTSGVYHFVDDPVVTEVPQHDKDIVWYRNFAALLKPEHASIPVPDLVQMDDELQARIYTDPKAVALYNAIEEMLDPEYHEWNLDVNDFANSNQERRDTRMAERILALRPDMHIGGLLHLFSTEFYPEGGGLTDKLGDAVSDRIILVDAYKY
ncbi:hypothetical protein JW868_04180 [Candidatus Woesearchaeota archaeon]|nr:hypothetical protein [Candidatus Woesearchaeota archaeon]